jgi:glucose-6-phosphate 1-dehydrogenase
VPFVLRSGKAIGAPRAEIALHLRPTAPPTGIAARDAGSVLRISLVDGGIALDLHVDDAMHQALVPLALAGDAPEGPLSAYGQVVLGLLAGDRLLSVSRDVAEQCWRIVTPVLAAWADGTAPLEEYEAGSAGPEDW